MRKTEAGEYIYLSNCQLEWYALSIVGKKRSAHRCVCALRAACKYPQGHRVYRFLLKLYIEIGVKPKKDSCLLLQQ